MAAGSLSLELWQSCTYAEDAAFPSAAVHGDCPVDTEDEGTVCACLRDILIVDS